MNDQTPIIVQTLGTRPTIPSLDWLIWAAALAEYRRLGYETVFCSYGPEDEAALEQHGLTRLFSRVWRIDPRERPWNAQDMWLIDESRFWSFRKMLAYYWVSETEDLNGSKRPVIAADADVLITRPLPLDGFDCVVWGPDQDPTNKDEYGMIYPDWEQFEFAKGYSLPAYVQNEKLAYNTGVLYIKDAKLAGRYFDDAVDFMMATKDPKGPHWECCAMANAEQRILKAIVDDAGCHTVCLSPFPYQNVWENYSHYYQLRDVWRRAAKEPNLRAYATHTMNVAAYRCLSILMADDPEAYELFTSKTPFSWFRSSMGQGVVQLAMQVEDYR